MSTYRPPLQGAESLRDSNVGQDIKPEAPAGNHSGAFKAVRGAATVARELPVKPAGTAGGQAAKAKQARADQTSTLAPSPPSAPAAAVTMADNMYDFSAGTWGGAGGAPV